MKPAIAPGENVPKISIWAMLSTRFKTLDLGMCPHMTFYLFLLKNN